MIYGNRMNRNLELYNQFNKISLFLDTMNNDDFIIEFSNDVNRNIITESKIGSIISAIVKIIKDAIVKFGKMIGRFISTAAKKIKEFFTKSKRETSEKAKELEQISKKEPEINKEKAKEQAKELETIINHISNEIDNNEKDTNIVTAKKEEKDKYKKIELPKNGEAYKDRMSYSMIKNISNGGIKRMRYLFRESTDIDPTFEEYKKVFQLAKQHGFVEDHEERTPFKSEAELKTMNSDELLDYYIAIKRDLAENLSEERMDYQIKLSQIIHSEKFKRFKEENKKDNNKSTDTKDSLDYINYGLLFGRIYNAFETAFKDYKLDDIIDINSSDFRHNINNNNENLNKTNIEKVFSIENYENKAEEIKRAQNEMYPDILIDIKELGTLKELFSSHVNGESFRNDFNKILSLSEDDLRKYNFLTTDVYNMNINGLNKLYSDQNESINDNIKKFEGIKSNIERTLKAIKHDMDSIENQLNSQTQSDTAQVNYDSTYFTNKTVKTVEIPIKPVKTYLNAVKSIISDLFSSISTVTNVFNKLQIKSISYLNRFYMERMNYLYG